MARLPKVPRLLCGRGVWGEGVTGRKTLRDTHSHRYAACHSGRISVTAQFHDREEMSCAPEKQTTVCSPSGEARAPAPGISTFQKAWRLARRATSTSQIRGTAASRNSLLEADCRPVWS